MLSESLTLAVNVLINFACQWARGLKHWHATTHTKNRFQLESCLRLSAAFLRCRPEVDILPGKTWKCSMRSAFCWFAEICHSQSLSHFAASFIVTRAEGSIVESCNRIDFAIQLFEQQFQKSVSRVYLVTRSLAQEGHRQAPLSQSKCN